MPRRVSITRNTRKAGNAPLKFHQAERLHIVAVAAGTTHSTVVSEDGLIFYWVSADPNVRCHQVGFLLKLLLTELIESMLLLLMLVIFKM